MPTRPRLLLLQSSVVVLALACSDAAPPQVEPKNPQPTISSISPASINAGAFAFGMTISGAHFMPASTVSWNGVAHASTFLDSTAIHVDVASADVATAGTVSIAVINPPPGGGASAGASLTINPLFPHVTGVTPNTAVAGSGSVVITLIGSNFRPSTVVQWNGQSRATTYVSSTSITATILAQDISSTGTATVKAFDTASGFVSSSAATFTITLNPAPQLTSVSPANGVVGMNGLTVTVRGANFGPEMVVQVNGAPRPTSFVDATTLTATLSSKDLEAATVLVMYVNNPVTKQVSNTLNFVVSLTATPGPTVPIPATLWQPPKSAIPASGNYLYVESDAGDYIGGGQITLVTTPFAFFPIVGQRAAAAAMFSGGGWNAEFASMAGVPQFVTGYYPNVTRAPFNNSGVGGLSIDSPGRGCNSISGWFAIDTVSYAGTSLNSFTARFEQHCERLAPALRGIIRWTR